MGEQLTSLRRSTRAQQILRTPYENERSEELKTLAVQKRNEMLENLADFDDELAERFLGASDEDVSFRLLLLRRDG